MADTYLNSLLGDNERVVFVTHPHWLILVSEVISEAVLAIALVVLIALIWLLWLPNPFILLGYLLLAFPILSFLRDYSVWSNRKYVITNWRVIQIAGVFNKDVTDSSLDKVNDVKLEQSVLGRMFDYGDVEILTASDLGVNLFKMVGQPIRLKTEMLNAKEKLEHGDSRPMRSARAAAASTTPNPADLLAQLDELRKHGVLTEEEFQQKKAKLLAKI